MPNEAAEVFICFLQGSLGALIIQKDCFKFSDAALEFDAFICRCRLFVVAAAHLNLPANKE